MKALYDWAAELADRGDASEAEVKELLDACRLAAQGDTPVDALSPPLVGPTPAPAEAVVSALLPLGRFLGSGGRGGPSPTAAAAVAVAAEARALVDALATARAGDDRVPAERWQAVFGELNRQLCCAVSDAQMPQGVRADLSAAYRAMLEALLPRFGALRGAAGPAPDSTSARMLTGFKRALRQRGAPLPLLLPDAVAMLRTAADLLGRGGRGGGGGGDGRASRAASAGWAADGPRDAPGGLATPPPAPAPPPCWRTTPDSPFDDDTARALGQRAPDDSALALAARLLATVGPAGRGGEGDVLGHDLRERLLQYACRGLRDSLRDVLTPDEAADGGAGGSSGALLTHSSSAARLADGGADTAPRLPSPAFLSATAQLAADLAAGIAGVPPRRATCGQHRPAVNGGTVDDQGGPVSVSSFMGDAASSSSSSAAGRVVAAARGALFGARGPPPVPPTSPPPAPSALPFSRPSPAGEDALVTTGDLLLEAAEACVALAWQLGNVAPASARALALASALVRASAGVLAECAASGLAGALDASERVHALMRSAARLAEDADAACEADQGDVALDVPPVVAPAPRRVWRWNVGGMQSFGVPKLVADPSTGAASLSAPSAARTPSAPAGYSLAPPTPAAPPAPRPAAVTWTAAERLCDDASAALTAVLGAQWLAGDGEGVKAALVPLADLSVQADTGGALPREQQAELLTAGRLAADLAGDADLLATVVPLLSASGVAAAAPSVRACSVHVIACLAALAGRNGQRWAYETQVDALVKAYKAPDGQAAPLLHAGVEGDALAAAAGVPGSLAAALHTVAAGLRAAPRAARAEFLGRLLGLFADVGSVARPGDGGPALDLGALLPAIAEAAAPGEDGTSPVEGAGLLLGDGVPAGGGAAGAAADADVLARPSALPSTTFGSPHASGDPDFVKAFRLLWLYVGVHGFAGVVGQEAGRRGANPSPDAPPAVWRAAAGRLAAVSPQIAVTSEGESVKLAAELGGRLHRLGGTTAAVGAAAALSARVPKPPAAWLPPTTTPEGWARIAHLLSVATLELARVELAPLGYAAGGGGCGGAGAVAGSHTVSFSRAPATSLPYAQPASPLDLLLAAQHTAEPGIWVRPWLVATAEAACAAYCARLAGRLAPPDSDSPDAVAPALSALATSLVAATCPAGGQPSADGLASRLLNGVLVEFPSLMWRPALLGSLLAALGAHEAFAARAAGSGGGGSVVGPGGPPEDPGLRLAKAVLAAAAARAPEHAEALLHEPLRGAPGHAVAPAMRHAAELMAAVDAARPPFDAASASAPLAGVEALSRKSFYGGLAAGQAADGGGLQHAADELGAALGLKADGVVGGAGADGRALLPTPATPPPAKAAAGTTPATPNPHPAARPSASELEDRLLAAAAVLVTRPDDPAADGVLRLLAWAPARRLRPSVARAAAMCWAWVAAAAPGLRVRLAAQVGAAWAHTVDAQAGLFARSYDAEAFHMSPGGDPDDHPDLTRGVRAHGVWLAYWGELWQACGGGVGADARAVCDVIGRVLHRSLADARGLTQHPAAAGARARLVTLALLHARRHEAAAPGGGCPPAAAALFQRALRAALLWHVGPPAWYGRWSAAEAADEAAALRELAVVVARTATWPALAPGPRPAGVAPTAPAPDPVWGPATASGPDRVDLLRLLQAAEVERAETWHRPLGLPESPPSVVGRVSPARWRVHVATAWDVSPRLALSLPERLPENAVVSAELARLVAQHAHDPAIQAIPRAAMLLADGVVAARGGGDGVELGGYTAANGGPKAAAAANGGGDSDHTPLDALTLWAPAPLLQAMSMLGGAAGGVPAVRAYALRSLEACPAEQVSQFLPQLVQLLRGDGPSGQIAAYLLAAAARSVLYAHVLICTLKAEGTPPEEAFAPAVKRSGWQAPVDSGLWALADGLTARVWSAMPPDKLARLAAELEYFDAVTAVSGALYPVPKDERKNEAVRLVRGIDVPRPDLYLPTDPGARVLRAVPETATPMQSAAKVPILVAFEVEKEVEGGAGEEDGRAGDDSGLDSAAAPPAPRTRTAVQGCIFKVGDDCRQDVLALQVIRLLQDALRKAGVDLYLAPYGVIPTAYECGIIEVVPDCRSRSALGETCDGGLYEIWLREFGAPGSPRFEAARSNFISSAAGYAIACYLLQAKDRHNGNIMISKAQDGDGHLVHIDFGFILGISPGGNLGFESAAFKLSHEMTQLLDPGATRKSPQFLQFLAACVRGYLAARGAADPIVAAVSLMAASGLPCFGHGAPLPRLRARFCPGMTDAQAAAFFRGATLDAYDKWTTGFYDFIQYVQNAIPK